MCSKSIVSSCYNVRLCRRIYFRSIVQMLYNALLFIVYGFDLYYPPTYILQEYICVFQNYRLLNLKITVYYVYFTV